MPRHLSDPRTEAGLVSKIPIADESRPPDWEHFCLPNPEYMTVELVPHAGDTAILYEPVIMVSAAIEIMPSARLKYM